MSSASNPVQPQATDPALIAALAGVAASNQQIAANVAAADSSKQTFTTIEGDFKPRNIFDPNACIAVAADQKTREVIITNNSTVQGANAPQFKVIVGTSNLPNTSTPYAQIINYEQGIVMPGGSQVISDPTCRSVIYIISNVDQAPVNILRNFLVIPVMPVAN
jgi:hypothetical protein